MEIGVFKGGSLRMWRKYFGESAIIFGIDIDENCREYDGHAAQVRIGSQIDEKFLTSVIDEMGGVDIVLDDGSHHMRHIKKTLSHIFPSLSEGGVYMIEDLHTSYWKVYGGGYNARGNFFNFVRELSHDIHRWYHNKGSKHPEISKNCNVIHIHDSIVVLEKGNVFPPVHSEVG